MPGSVSVPEIVIENPFVPPTDHMDRYAQEDPPTDPIPPIEVPSLPLPVNPEEI
jgi:hypothetical protein